jgi:hypothetical protein
MSSNYLSLFTATNTTGTDILSQVSYSNYARIWKGTVTGNVGSFDVGNTRVVYSNGFLYTNSGGLAEVTVAVGFGNVPSVFCNGRSPNGFYFVDFLSYTSTTTQIQCVINSASENEPINFVIVGLKPS